MNLVLRLHILSNPKRVKGFSERDFRESIKSELEEMVKEGLLIKNHNERKFHITSKGAKVLFEALLSHSTLSEIEEQADIELHFGTQGVETHITGNNFLGEENTEELNKSDFAIEEDRIKAENFLSAIFPGVWHISLREEWFEELGADFGMVCFR